MAEKTWFTNRTQTSVLLRSVERRGRNMNLEVLNVAQSITIRVTPSDEELIGDPEFNRCQ